MNRPVLLQRRSITLTLLTFASYLLIYLAATRQVVLTTSPENVFLLLPQWENLLWRERSLFVFEPIASLTIGNLRLFVSPPNLAVALALSALVALNVAVSVAVLYRLGVRGGRGFLNLLGTVPAIVSGTACCVPTVVLLLGLQLTATLSTLWSLFLPLSLALLTLSLWWSLRHSPWLCRR